MFRTDENNNPAAFIVQIAEQAGLILGKDYEPGTPFNDGSGLVTAKLLGDPIKLTIQVINAIGYYTRTGESRWTYIAIPHNIWKNLTWNQKRDIVGFHYKREGGTTMIPLFPNYTTFH